MSIVPWSITIIPYMYVSSLFEVYIHVTHGSNILFVVWFSFGICMRTFVDCSIQVACAPCFDKGQE